MKNVPHSSYHAQRRGGAEGGFSGSQRSQTEMGENRRAPGRELICRGDTVHGEAQGRGHS